MEYNCELCKYKTTHQTNYKKHLTSNKHKKNEDEFNKKKFSCKYCGQMYHHKQSVNKHIKYSCTKNKDEDVKEFVKLLNDQNKQQHIEIEHQKKQLEKKDKQIEKLMEKLEINHTNNTNNTFNTIIQNITLLSYNETDTSHLTYNDYKTCINTRNWCIVKIIEKIHFNPNKPENRNIYISNIKSNYVMVYQDGVWQITDNYDLIDNMYDTKQELIADWLEIDKESKKDLKKDFERFLELKDDDKNVKILYNHVKLLLYNNRPQKQIQNQIE